MKTIHTIYFLVHQDYDRIGHLSGEGEYLWHVDPESYDIWLRAKRNQHHLINEIKQRTDTALIVFPCIFPFFTIYEFLPLHERKIIESYLLDLRDWGQTLGDRFMILTPDEFEDKKVDGRQQAEVVSPHLGVELPFTYSPTRTKVKAFGEAIRGCVNDYGRALTRGLGISERNFEIVREASLQQLMHESETEFYQQLGPGWRK